MSTEPPAKPAVRHPLLRNWLSLSGLVMMVASLFSFLLLFLLDLFAHTANPYIGVLTYLVSPAFTAIGLVMVVVGVLRWRYKLRKTVGGVLAVQFDLMRPHDRRVMGVFLTGSVAFLLISAVGVYHSYHFTESVTFCGQACHTVMKPELVTYLHGPHARVSCSQCHIGPGATWYVRSKLSGAYQVYAVAANKFPRPIPTPIKNLRPAQETCEQCHWPKEFVGNVDRTFTYFLGDETNTPHSIRMLLKVGGADPTHGPVGGIHWHMNVANKVEYLAAKVVQGVWVPDEARQHIPWVRLTDPQGVVTEFRVRGFTNAVDPAQIRVMDCMDCHNRPAHRFQSPNDAVNLAMSLGRIDPSLPWIKTNAVYALTKTYQTETEALQQIATFLANKYPTEPRIRPVIDVVQQIYRDNFFAEMKANWRVYPDNIGHKDWPGCVRCHDDKHVTADGKKAIKFSDCNSCHIITAQGYGKQLEQLNARGQPFVHPGEEPDKDFRCHDCHTGGP
jgi:nitrate/TMAO reductase-like tetraheme cytochrome c subunit